MPKMLVTTQMPPDEKGSMKELTCKVTQCILLLHVSQKQMTLCHGLSQGPTFSWVG